MQAITVKSRLKASVTVIPHESYTFPNIIDPKISPTPRPTKQSRAIEFFLDSFQFSSIIVSTIIFMKSEPKMPMLNAD